ncbi:MAG: nicotinate-nucleotide adenylyltransferase [Synechococcus sp.]|nr:nicotinate-nucleotide adenylyltransferase [Synechococcus sp.]
MSSIALLGTSADPPTCGHQALLEQLLLHHDHVVTWASDNPSKQHGLPLSERRVLLQTLVDAIANPRLSLKQELSSPWAITTINRAQALWPSQQLCFVIGSDLVEQVLHWKQADALLKRCQLTVVPRMGWPLSAELLTPLRNCGATVTQLALQIPGTASSRARRHADPAQIPPVLRPLLEKHGFYGFNADPN